MKYFLSILIIASVIFSCDSSKSVMKGDSEAVVEKDRVRIANDSLEYEIIIIEPGFDSYLISQPPMGYYELSFLENRNAFYVVEFNNRVRDLRYSRNLYNQEIEYRSNIDYGLEVNYLLYNYFQFFEQRYKQKLR
jgi:hypothetical protein